MQIDEQPPSVRVAKGTRIEQQMADCLNKHHGWQLKQATHLQDCVGKIDFIEESRGLIQAKSRASGDDILYDRMEPFYGVKHKDNKPGRDHVGKYDFYICLSQDQTRIRVIDARRLKQIVEELDKEWAKNGYDLPFYSSKFSSQIAHPQYGFVTKSCEIRKHRDAHSGVPKLLYFFPEEIFDEGEIEVYPFILEN